MTTSMLAQEHISYVNAVQYGDGSRTSATVQAAQNFIGSTFAVLLLAKTGNGIWTLNSNHVFASNIVVLIPPGVVLAGTGNLTFQGQVQAASGEGTWYAGTGILTFPAFAGVTYFNYIQARGLALNTGTPHSQLHVSGDTPVPATITVEQRTLGAGNAGLEFWSGGSTKGFFGLGSGGGGQDLILDLRGTGGNLIIGGPGGGKLGLNTLTVPLATFHVSGDTALPATVRLEERTAGAGGATLNWWSAGTQRGAMGLPGTQDVTLQLLNSARFVVNGGNMGIGIIPSAGQQLELSTGGAQKSTGTAWTNPSDARIKDVQRPYTDGLNVIAQIKAYWVKFNGRAGTPAEVPEFVAPLAHEVQLVAPYMVGSYPAKLDPDDPTETQILNFDGSAMLFALINAVQEQQTLIQALTDRVAALEAALP